MVARAADQGASNPAAVQPAGVVPQFSQHVYQAVVESAPNAMVMINASGQIVLINRQAEILFGYSRQQLLGKPVEVLIPARVRNHHPGLREGYKHNPQPRFMGVGRDLYGVRQDGVEIPLEIGLNPIDTAEGRFVLAAIVDITERKRADERFRAMVESAPNALIMINTAGEIVLVNYQTEKLFGYDPGELIGQRLDILVPMRSRGHHPKLREGFFSEPRPRMMGAGRDLFGVRKDGVEIPVEIGLNPLSTREGTFVLAAIVDITERKRAEAEFRTRIERELAEKTHALEASERRYRAMAEAMPIAVFTAAADGTLDYLNKALLGYYGRPEAELLNADWAQFTHPEDAVKLNFAFARSVAEGTPLEVLSRERRHDGEYRWHITRAVPERDGEGRIIKWYGGMLDVEDLQRAKAAAEAAMHAKADFLAVMSHEIRTPLNATINMTGLLLDTPLNQQQLEFAETIRNSGQQLLTIINDILDFSKIEAGKLMLGSTPFDLRLCIEDALDLVSLAASRKKLELTYEYLPPTPQGVVGDPDRLRQVLVNLLSNAVKFTERGEVSVRVSAEALAENHHRIMIGVHDTGIGMSENEMARLFQPFSQVDASATRRFEGTGLGLAICRKLASAMQGEIRVESRPGLGSTFHFSFVADTVTRREADALWNSGRTALTGLRVLIVDDNATSRRILRHHAEAWRMTVVEFESAAAALAHAHTAEPFHIALLDFMMPGMDGLALARELRQTNGNAKLAIVILSSVNLPPGDLARSGVQPQSVFMKPIRQSILYDALCDAISPRSVSTDRRQRRGRISMEHSPSSAGPEAQGVSILLAEDNSVNQRVALLLLQRLGYRADIVSNGLEAVQAAGKRCYDIILMDVMMPEMDGLEATRRIRAQPGSQPHIIAMTAVAMEGDRERCIAAGMDAYISKPIQPEQLLAALREGAERHSAATESPAATRTEHNPDTLSKLRATFGSGEAQGILDDIVRDAPRLLSGLSAALTRTDAESIRLFAHTMKSMSAMVGATSLSSGLQQLERFGAEGKPTEAAAIGSGLVARYRSLIAELHPAGTPSGPWRSTLTVAASPDQSRNDTSRHS